MNDLSYNSNLLYLTKSGGDLQKFITDKKIGFPWAKYKGELHLLNHNFTGPGTNLDKRLDENDNYLPGSKPVNRVDEASMRHDIAYRKAKDDLKLKHEADKIMIQELDNIPNPSIRERLERTIAKNMLKLKMKMGGSLKTGGVLIPQIITKSGIVNLTKNLNPSSINPNIIKKINPNVIKKINTPSSALLRLVAPGVAPKESLTKNKNIKNIKHYDKYNFSEIGRAHV